MLQSRKPASRQMFWPLFLTQPPSLPMWRFLPMNQDQSAQSVVSPCPSIEVSSPLEKVSASAWFSTLQRYEDTWLNSEGNPTIGSSFQHPVSGDLPPWQIRGCWSISKGYGGSCCLKHFLEELLFVLPHQNSLVSVSVFLTLVLRNKYWLLLLAFLLLKTILHPVSVTLLISLMLFYMHCSPNFKVL